MTFASRARRPKADQKLGWMGSGPRSVTTSSTGVRRRATEGIAGGPAGPLRRNAEPPRTRGGYDGRVNTQTPTETLRELADLPAPRGLPIVGNLFQLSRPVIHRDMERLARELGPLFRVRVGARDMVAIADHALIGQVLRERPQSFRRSPRTQQIGQEMGLMPGLFGSEGDSWRPQRKMVMAGLDPTRVRGYFPMLLRVLLRLERRWLAAAREGRALELQPELMRFSVDAIAGLAFGSDVNTLESDGEIIQQHLDKIFPALYRRSMAMVPTWRWFRRQADRDLDASIVEVKKAIADFIAQARQRLDADPARRAAPPNLLESMIVAAEEPGSGIDNLMVAGNVLTMLLAGEDTTANTLAWAMNLLHENPQALARAADEVRGLGVPLVAIFGPTRDRQTAPLTSGVDAPAPRLAIHDVWCRPCMLRECPLGHMCMRGVTAAQVASLLP